MTLAEDESYPDRRFRFTVAWLSVLLLILVLLGLLSHPKNPVSHAVWKSAPYGEPRDTVSIRAGR
jgi:hypothetical protein